MDQFEIAEKGIAATCIAEDDSLRLTPGIAVVLRRTGTPDVQTELLGFEVFRNDWSPHKPRNFGLLLPAKLGLSAVPRHTEVWANV
jgi:hypothetical protein